MVNDFHFSHVDSAALELFLTFAKDIQPDTIILNGDVIDCTEISTFLRSAWNIDTFDEDVRQTQKFFKALRQACPRARIIYIYGNHEFRLQKYISINAKEIAFLPGVQLEHILSLNTYDVESVPIRSELSKFSDNFIVMDDIYIGHFNKVNKHSAYTAKNLVEDKGVSIIQAHTHRGGVHYRTLIDGTVLVGVENFCMCHNNPGYLNNPNWQKGFTIITDNTICPIDLSDYKFYWGNKKYE